MTRDTNRATPGNGTLALRERKRIVDSVNITLLVAVSVAVAVPWFLRVLPIDLALVARLTLAYVLFYAAVARLADRLGGRKTLNIVAGLLQGTTIGFLGVLWLLVGGLGAPMLLLAFLVPVLVSGAVFGRADAYAAATGSIAFVVLAALAESRELRWYLFQLGLPVEWVSRWLPSLSSGPKPFPGVVGQPAYEFVVLETFAVLQLAAALLAHRLAQVLPALYRHVAAAQDVPELFATALRAAPAPTLLVALDSGRIVLASQTFFERMLLHAEDLAERDVFQLIRFADPAAVRALLHSEGGEIGFCPYQVGQEPRVAALRIHTFSHRKARYAYLSLEDRTDLFYLEAAIQDLDEPLLVLGADNRLRYANHAAAGIFGELYFGMEAPGPLLELVGSSDPANGDVAPRDACRLVIQDAMYVMSMVVSAPAARNEALRIVRLYPEPPANGHR